MEIFTKTDKINIYDTLSKTALCFSGLTFVWAIITLVASINPLSIITKFNRLTAIFFILLLMTILGLIGFKKLKEKAKKLRTQKK